MAEEWDIQIEEMTDKQIIDCIRMSKEERDARNKNRQEKERAS